MGSDVDAAPTSGRTGGVAATPAEVGGWRRINSAGLPVRVYPSSSSLTSPCTGLTTSRRRRASKAMDPRSMLISGA